MTAPMLAADAAENPRAVVGGNNPPPSPFDLSRAEIEKLYDECLLWLDGKPIETDAQADDLAALLRLMQAAKDRADDRRVEEKRPHDEAAAAVQEKYAPLVGDTKKVKGKAVRAIETLKALIGARLAKKAAEQRAAAEAARAEADRLATEARAAFQATPATDLAGREAAEERGGAAMNSTVHFLNAAAFWFEQRAAEATEDSVHQAMAQNARNLREAATRMASMEKALLPFKEAWGVAAKLVHHGSLGDYEAMTTRHLPGGSVQRAAFALLEPQS